MACGTVAMGPTPGQADARSVVADHHFRHRAPPRGVRVDGPSGHHHVDAEIRVDLPDEGHIAVRQHQTTTPTVELTVHVTEANLVVCRNTLIYFESPLQDRALRLFWESIADRGYLALGTKESMEFSGCRSRFEASGPHRIYRRRPRGASAELAEVAGGS